MPRSSVESKTRTTDVRTWRGYAAATAVVVIWAMWLVVSRSGAQSELTVYDLAALRYGVSGVIALPIIWYFKPWRRMTTGQIVALTFLLGPVYTLFLFNGFVYAPAAHGGIFMNGALPAITLLIGWFWFREKPHGPQWAGVGLIIVGAILAVLDVSRLSLDQSWIGDMMFLISGVFFSVYLIISRRWNLGATEVLLCGSLINAVIYIPIWLLFLPTGLADVTDSQFTMQFLYQGLVPNLIGLLLVGVAVRYVGPAVTAAFMAAVPGVGTVLSLMLLGEVPGVLGWLSLVLLTPGILMVVLTVKK